MEFALVALGINLFGIISAILMYFVIYPKIINKNVVSRKRNRKRTQQKLYQKLVKVPLLGSSLQSISSKIYVVTAEDDATVQSKAIKIYIISWVGIIGAFIIIALLAVNDIYTFSVTFIICVYMRTILVDSMVGDDTKVLYALVEFLEDMKHKYHETKNIDTALNYAIYEGNGVMTNHGKKLLLAVRTEKNLLKYYSNSLNKYFKIIAGYSYLTKEYGDIKSNGKSLFVRNIYYIVDEINQDLFRRDQLRHYLKWMPLTAIVPLFFIKPIEKWATYLFASADKFYDSGFAFSVQVLLLLFTFGCFTLVKYYDNIRSTSGITVSESKFERRLLKNPLVAYIINLWVPKKSSKKYKKVITLIRESGSIMKIEWLYLRKLICIVGVFIFGIGFSLTLNYRAYSSVLTNSNTNFPSEIILVNGVQEDISEYDAIVLKELMNTTQSTDQALAKSKALLLAEDITEDFMIQEICDRALAKLEYMGNQYLKWYQVLASLVAALVAMDIPVIILRFQKKIRKLGMKDEVFQFDTTILLLMHHESVDMRTVLQWMERFSNVFRIPILKAMYALSMGSERALVKMKIETSFKPFSRLIDNLIMSERITLAKAFDSLETERESYKEERKRHNKRDVAKRVRLARRAGTAPMFAIMYCYMIGPLLWVAGTDLIGTMTKVNTIM